MLTIAIGVPTVVNAAVIAQVTIEHFLKSFRQTRCSTRSSSSVMPDYTQAIINDILTPSAEP